MAIPSPVIVALDFAAVETALALVDRLPAGTCRLKIGKELFVRGGPTLVERLVRDGWEVFLDLKFHDIPNTVAAACRAASDLGVWMVNVHALGGPAMMAAARDAIPGGGGGPLLTAVTILTSHNQRTLEEVGIRGTPEDAVRRLDRLVAGAGLDGVVCSAREAAMLSREHDAGYRLVTPGIRPAAVAGDDQRRVMTPTEAITAGATDLVVGRPITRATDPAAALAGINAELAELGV